MFEFAQPLHDLIEELRHRGQDRPADRFLLPRAPDRGRRPAGRGHPGGQKEDLLLRALQQHHPRRSLPDLFRSPTVRRVPVHRRGAVQHLFHREDGRLQRAISRPPRRPLAAQGPRAGRAPAGETRQEDRGGGFQGDHRRHQPDGGRGGHGPLPSPGPQGVRRPDHASGHGAPGRLRPRFRRPGDHQESPGGPDGAQGLTRHAANGVRKYRRSPT